MSTLTDRANPWNLTPGQCAALDAVVTAGCEKRAADDLGLSIKTVSTQVCRAKKRMEVTTRLLALLEWDRFQRGRA